MEINLENAKEIRFFKNNWNTIYRKNKALDSINNAKVVISAKLLSDFFTEEEKYKDELLTELLLLKYNFVNELIGFELELNTDRSESEVKKSCINEIRKELSFLKAEEDLAYVDFSTPKYAMLGIIQDGYCLEPEVLIEKVEKDLAEIEVPVNAVEEPVPTEKEEVALEGLGALFG